MQKRVNISQDLFTSCLLWFIAALWSGQWLHCTHTTTCTTCQVAILTVIQCQYSGVGGLNFVQIFFSPLKRPAPSVQTYAYHSRNHTWHKKTCAHRLSIRHGVLHYVPPEKRPSCGHWV